MTHETHHPAITLSRTLGSGGSLIAYHVAQQLGWRYLDRRILRRTAAELGLDLAAMGRGEERPDRFIDRLLQVMAVASPESPYTPPVEVPLYGRDIYEQEVHIMRDLLAGAPAVLVGRGGFVAFRPRQLRPHRGSQPRGVRALRTPDHRGAGEPRQGIVGRDVRAEVPPGKQAHGQRPRRQGPVLSHL